MNEEQLQQNFEQHIRDICAVSDDFGGGYPQKITRPLLRHYLANSCKRLEVVEEKFRDFGYRVRRQEFAYHGEIAVNALFRNRDADGTAKRKVNGKLQKKETWIMAHHDYLAGLGAEDNATGLAVIIELARAFQGSEGVAFASFDLKEYGLVGSNYCADHLNERQRQQIKCVIALESLGSGKDVTICASVRGIESDKNIVDKLYHISEQRFVPEDYNLFSSDHVPFIHGGLSGVELCSLDHAKYSRRNGRNTTPGKVGSIAHTANDRPENITSLDNPSFDNLVQVYQVLVEFLQKKRIRGDYHPHSNSIAYEFLG